MSSIRVTAPLRASARPLSVTPELICFYSNGFSFAELEATPGYPNYSGGGVARVLGLPTGGSGLPGGFALLVRIAGSKGPGFRILKSDIGDGAGNAPHATVDLHPAVAAALGFGGSQDIQIKAAGASPGASPASGAQTVAQCTTGAVAAGTYVNPFRLIKGLVAQLVDMGVDYDGTGPITSLGPRESSLRVPASAAVGPARVVPAAAWSISSSTDQTRTATCTSLKTWCQRSRLTPPRSSRRERRSPT